MEDIKQNLIIKKKPQGFTLLFSTVLVLIVKLLSLKISIENLNLLIK